MHLHTQYLGSLLSVLMLSPEYRQCRIRYLNHEVVISGYVPGSHCHTKVLRVLSPSRSPIDHLYRNCTLWNVYTFTAADYLPSRSLHRNLIRTKTWWLLLRCWRNSEKHSESSCHILVRSNTCTTSATCHPSLDFCHHIVRHNNSSMHV